MVKFMTPIISKFLECLPGKGLLVDLGAGDGRHSLVLAEKGYDVIAVERNEPPLRHEHIVWRVMRIEDWLTSLPADFSVEGFLLKNVLQFLEREFVLNELLPGLVLHTAPGGVVAIETFTAPSDPPMKNQISCFFTKELAVPFAGWHIEMQEELELEADDMRGVKRKFALARFVAKRPLIS